jgi:hypothetical protein
MSIINRRRFIKKSATAAGISLAFGDLMANLDISSTISQQSISGIKTRHPSLHFDAGKLKQLRKQALGTHEVYANRLYAWVDEKKSWTPPKITGIDGDEVPLEESGAFLTNAALAYSLSGKNEYLEISRKWALAMCEYPKDAIAIRNYGIGIYAAGLARAYDWLYYKLTSKEKEILKDSILDIVSRIYKGTQDGAIVPMWWTKAYLHHDHWIAVGGFGEAALALIGEVEDAGKYAAYAKANFDIIWSWLADDGAWHEGAADWCYALAPTLWFYGAWESVVGENLQKVPWIKNTALYRLYHWLPDNSYIYLNDSFRSGRYSTSGGASCHLLRRLASIFRDGHAQWLADQDEVFDMKPSPKGVYQAPYEKLSFTGEPKEYPNPQSQCASWNMLWYDPSVEPIPPEQLPNAQHFTNQGIVIMRTGWNKDDAIVSLHCAPLSGHKCAERVRNGEKIVENFFSHAHVDYNAFTLFTRGQYFIIPAGYAKRSSGFQNVVCVNGNNFIGDPSLNIKMVGFRNEKDFSYAIGDATDGFSPQQGVQLYRRHILLFENKWLIVFDDLTLNELGTRFRGYNHFSWTVHSHPKTHNFTISGNSVVWKSNNENKPTLTLYLSEPQEFAWERKLLQSTKGLVMMEALRLSKPEWNSNKMQVMSVWKWDDLPEAPRLYKHQDFIAVLLGKDKGIGFLQKPGIPSGLSGNELKGCELILFGSEPDKPDSFIRVKDGKIL